MIDHPCYNYSIVNSKAAQVLVTPVPPLTTERDKLSMVSSDSTTASSPCYLYIIQAASGPIKIGLTDNLERRLRILQTGHYESLVVLHVIECIDFVSALHVEKTFHKRYKEFRIRNEWYSVSAEAVKADVEFLRDLLSSIVSIDSVVLMTANKTPTREIRDLVRQFLDQHPEHMATRLDDLVPLIESETGVKVGRTSIHNARKDMERGG